jgi:hypothetical protein
MVIGDTIIDIAKANFELFFYEEIRLSFPCVLPLLEAMQALSKFAQTQIIFICDFIYLAKLYQFGLQEIYCELKKMFLFKHFNSFIDLVEHAHDHLCLT